MAVKMYCTAPIFEAIKDIKTHLNKDHYLMSCKFRIKKGKLLLTYSIE